MREPTECWLYMVDGTEEQSVSRSGYLTPLHSRYVSELMAGNTIASVTFLDRTWAYCARRKIRFYCHLRNSGALG
jgi:hypothetical protein